MTGRTKAGTGLRNHLAGLAMLVGFVAAPLAAQADGVTVSHGFSNFGALKYDADFARLAYVNPQAPKGGEISVWTQGNFDSFNQYARDGVAAALNTIGIERVLTSTADDPYGLYCYLCTTLEYPEDLSWVIFNLREDVVFQDGTPMTAEDIAFSHRLFLEQGIVEYRRLVEDFFTEVEILDPYRIKFGFKPGSSIRDRIGIAGLTPALSKKWFEENDMRLDKSTKRPFMSSGPYVLDGFEFNRRVVYRRDPNHWGKDLPFNIGRHNFDKIRVEYFADPAAAFEGFKSGIYTFRIESEPKVWKEQYDFPNIKNGHVVLAEPVDQTVGQHLAWAFNLDRPKWQDKRVRQAIAMMFNFEWTNATLFHDLYKQPESFWDGTDLAARGLPTHGELAILRPLVDEGLLDGAILEQEAFTHAPNRVKRSKPSRKVLKEADALLNAAGWIVGDDGVRRKDGRPLELVMLQTFPKYFPVVEPFLQNLQALGIQARMDRVDTSEYVERRRAGDFDLTNHGFQMEFEPSLGLVQWFGSLTADNSSRNLMRLREPAVDRLIERVLEAQDLDAMKVAVRALDRTLRFQQFDIPLWYLDRTLLAYYDIYRHPESLPPLALGQYDFWWYDAEAAERLKQAGVLR